MRWGLAIGAGLGVGLLLAALAGVEHVSERRPSATAPKRATLVPERDLPTGAELEEAEVSASPRLTH